jgi:SnoaL-like polyketide cyclase
VSIESNKALVQQFWERILNRSELSTSDELVAPEFTLSLPATEELRAPEGVKTWANVIRGGLPDILFEIKQLITVTYIVDSPIPLEGSPAL